MEQLFLVPVKRGVVKLFGKDGSGKTSLKESLKKLEFNPTQASTSAIEIETVHSGETGYWQIVNEREVQQLIATFLDQLTLK